MAGVGDREHFVLGAGVVGPAAAGLEIHGAEFPSLGGRRRDRDQQRSVSLLIDVALTVPNCTDSAEPRLKPLTSTSVPGTPPIAVDYHHHRDQQAARLSVARGDACHIRHLGNGKTHEKTLITTTAHYHEYFAQCDGI